MKAAERKKIFDNIGKSLSVSLSLSWTQVRALLIYSTEMKDQLNKSGVVYSYLLYLIADRVKRWAYSRSGEQSCSKTHGFKSLGFCIRRTVPGRIGSFS